jgi:uroporphyrinogen decarboxylase
MQMCEVPELAVEVSLQPLRRYHMDAVIIFSDILVIPQAMGMDVIMAPGVGPVLPSPISEPSDIDKLDLNPDVEKKLGYVMDALNLARQKINGEVPLIGFVGGPMTLLCYMIEGGGSRTKAKLKTFLYEHPKASHNILQAITDVCVNFLVAQQRAGAQALQVFESVAAEVLTQEHFYEFCFPYLEQIAARVKDATPSTPIVCFSKGTSYAYEKLSHTQYDCLGLDWQTDPSEVRKLVGDRVSLQGNFDSSAIYASPEIIRTQVKKMLKSFGTQRYVANFGHGCFPDMDPAHVNTFIKAVQEISLEMNVNAAH